MKRRILVSSNCQTGGVAAALQVIFSEDQIIPFPLPATLDIKSEIKLIEFLKQVDVWVSIGNYDVIKKINLVKRIQLVRIPRIRFSAFHPDQVYARRISTNELLVPHYNSAIAIWAYKNNIEMKDAKALFNLKTFEELGYLDQWGRSVNQLRQLFNETDLNFLQFFLGIQREGLFMYSINHPKVIALIKLAKLAALKMGAAEDVLEKCIDINDGLNQIIWPLYPGIGESLSLPSSYEWKVGNDQWIMGLESFLGNAFQTYANQKIYPDDIVSVQTNEQLFNRVLGNQIKVKS